MPFNRKDWSEPQSESMTNKLLDKLKPQDALKPRIEEAQSKLQMQLSKLEKISAKLREKDQVIFKRVVHSLQNHDSHYAKLLSGELSEVRKMNKMVDSAKLALEQIQLRLHTVTEFGDVAATLGPAMARYEGNTRRIIFYDATSRSIIWTDFRLDRRYHVRIWPNIFW